MIRQATPADAPPIARLIILAMGSLAERFANSTDPQVVIDLFELFAGQTDNQYSYQNALVWEDETGICGMILAYDGAMLDELRNPFLSYIRNKLGFKGVPEDETQSGEYYIDCLAVRPDKQGKGIAKQLINALIAKADELGHKTVGLLVSNPLAKKLYLSIGFEEKNRVTLLGGQHDHLQKKLH
ncbi:GNAT family N-acetyltransferase [Mucilaginibacter sp. JRF]|uniref:GNAT family N-acetyltransferase n=1 Tax=Mucilaginibacter sp. JRF TaxID=2780088 RepID=UPI00187E3FEF|nr:GNAT family N-acetyltransferase [Mucilaginibacter sp. JRF]MBE9583202.1 GNAT family N-acetyltransferase [Mucilaginibacter sp. JRF]